MSIGYSSSAPKNILQQKLSETSKQSTLPSDDQVNISYGIITEVEYESSQVRVRNLTSDGKMGEETSDGFLPLITPLSEINLLWGSLREGLVVRIYREGNMRNNKAVVEIIGDEEHKFLSKDPVANEILLGPYRLFSGGAGL